MKTYLENLDNVLLYTGLPSRSIPFIHGALTAHIILPGHRDDIMRDAIACSVIFEVTGDSIPEKGIDDPRISKVIECAKVIQSEIIDQLHDGRFEPFFGKYSENTPDIEIPKEWCRGFIGTTFMAMDFPDKEEIPEEAAVAFGIILAYAQSDDKKMLKKIKPLAENLSVNTIETITECIYDIDFFWRDWEDKYFDYEDVFFDYAQEVPFVNNVNKTGRNDPCPCGSGKKYKKCCGKNV